MSSSTIHRKDSSGSTSSPNRSTIAGGQPVQGAPQGPGRVDPGVAGQPERRQDGQRRLHHSGGRRGDLLILGSRHLREGIDPGVCSGEVAVGRGECPDRLWSRASHDRRPARLGDWSMPRRATSRNSPSTPSTWLYKDGDLTPSSAATRARLSPEAPSRSRIAAPMAATACRGESDPGHQLRPLANLVMAAATGSGCSTCG